MRFSPRLKAILSLVEGRTLADIGTDHGFLPIAACLKGFVENAIACDLNPGPLERAKENISRYGLENKITTRLGYGLSPVSADDVDCVVIAGMGGINIVEILKEPFKCKRLIVQPQRDIQLVREALAGWNFKIIEEKVVHDRKHSYTVIGADYDNSMDNRCNGRVGAD